MDMQDFQGLHDEFGEMVSDPLPDARPPAEDAEAILVALRWPGGVDCPHCDSSHTYPLRSARSRRKKFKCGRCRKQFSVTKGTILEGSKLSLDHWIRIIRLLCESDGEFSIVRIQKELGVSYKAAQNLCYRLDYAIQREPLASLCRPATARET